MRLLQTVLQTGYPFKAKNSEGVTPILFASKHNYFQMINILSLISPNLNEEDVGGYTVLTHQVILKNFKMATILLSRGADINYVNSHGLTTIQICVEKKLK